MLRIAQEVQHIGLRSTFGNALVHRAVQVAVACCWKASAPASRPPSGIPSAGLQSASAAQFHSSQLISAMTAANGSFHVRPVKPENLAELRAKAANAVQDDKPVVFFVPGYTVRLWTSAVSLCTMHACMRLQLVSARRTCP